VLRNFWLRLRAWHSRNGDYGRVYFDNRQNDMQTDGRTDTIVYKVHVQTVKSTRQQSCICFKRRPHVQCHVLRVFLHL